MSDKVRIFIGSSANGEDAEAEMTYEYSLRKNTDREVEITWMKQTHDESSIWGGWATERWSTPFSGFRWAIPEACGFKGRAIYTDCDMINFRDIGDLLDEDLQGKPIGARPGTRFGGHEFCVMVFDCAAFEPYSIPVSRMKAIAESHHRMIGNFSGNSQLVHNLDPRWNCLDGENYAVDDIWHLHYTKMASQPWKPKWFKGTAEKHARPELVELWHKTRNEASEAGYVSGNYLPKEKYGEYNIIGM